METLDLVPGTAAWLSARKNCYGASEASAMLGLSPYVTRAELLHRKATGLDREYSEWFQENVLDHGHAVEALARPIAEEFLGEELYPVCARDGLLWVSTDGMTMAERIVWENKQWAGELAEMVSAGFLPEHHQPQCQQALMITGADRLLFTVSDGTPENTLFLWVEPDPAWFERLRLGWAQFHRDLESYEPPASAAPKLTGKTMETLPALRVMVEGKITDSNLTAWVAGARAIIAGINRDLKTDQQFADAEAAVKGCEKAENWLEAAESHALSQTEDIAAFFTTVRAVREEFRQVRLELEKLVTRRKTEVKTEIVSEHAAMFHTHIAELNDGLAPYRLPAIAADFAAAIKGKRSVQTATEAAGVVLANAKIEAASTANVMHANRRRIEANPEFAFLFNDTASLLLKDGEAVEAIVQNRITAHKAAELAKKEAETTRIRAEEQAKAEAAARANAAEILRQEREAQAERDREEKAQADRIAANEAEEARLHENRKREEAEHEQRRQDAASLAERQQAEADLKKLEAPAPSPVAESIVSSSLEVYERTPHPADVYGVRRSAPLPATDIPVEPEHAWINITKMNEAFGFTVTADLIVNTLGFSWTRTENAAKFWTPTQFEEIKRKLADLTLKATAIPF